MDIFNTSVKIYNLDLTKPKKDDIEFPFNVEICITRIPIRNKDGYTHKMMKTFAKKLKASMVQNGIVFLICYGPVESKGRPFEVASSMLKAGFKLVDTIVCEKSWLPGKRTESNLVNAFDYVFYFCNGDVWSLDRAPIREYLKTDSDITCPGNVWKIKTGSLEDSYSFDLSYLLIKMTACLPGSLIFEPFMSSRYSLMTALELGHSFIGFEPKVSKMKEYNKILNTYNNNKEGENNDL